MNLLTIDFEHLETICATQHINMLKTSVHKCTQGANTLQNKQCSKDSSTVDAQLMKELHENPLYKDEFSDGAHSKETSFSVPDIRESIEQKHQTYKTRYKTKRGVFFPTYNIGNNGSSVFKHR